MSGIVEARSFAGAAPSTRLSRERWDGPDGPTATGPAAEHRDPSAVAALLRRAVASTSTAKRFKTGQVIAAQPPSHHTHVILEGWAMRSRILARGRGQIMEILLSGDTYGGHAPSCPASASPVLSAVSACTVLTLPSGELRGLMRLDRDVAAALTQSLARRQAIIEEHLLRLGRRSALERTAHWLCETLVRRAGVGADSCDLPLIQSDLADLLGLSVVHMNRTMKTLRVDLGVTVTRKTLQVGDLKSLRALADFDSGYLMPDGRAEISRSPEDLSPPAINGAIALS